MLPGPTPLLSPMAVSRPPDTPLPMMLASLLMWPSRAPQCTLLRSLMPQLLMLPSPPMPLPPLPMPLPLLPMPPPLLPMPPPLLLMLVKPRLTYYPDLWQCHQEDSLCCCSGVYLFIYLNVWNKLVRNHIIQTVLIRYFANFTAKCSTNVLFWVTRFQVDLSHFQQRFASQIKNKSCNKLHLPKL